MTGQNVTKKGAGVRFFNLPETILASARDPSPAGAAAKKRERKRTAGHVVQAAPTGFQRHSPAARKPAQYRGCVLRWAERR
jgi:hypothetical protein